LNTVNFLRDRTMKKQTPPFPLRMPKELREWFDAAAKGNKRSLNAELVQCLEELQAKRAVNGQAPTAPE
jgi:hypothetical protein